MLIFIIKYHFINTFNIEEEKFEYVNTKTNTFIIIPYRNRKTNLLYFIQYMKHYLRDNINNIEFMIVEQDDNLPFNRGRLANVGIKLIRDNNSHNPCVIIHDVDLLPFPGVDYMNCNKPFHMSHELQHLSWKTHYDHYFGGVVSMKLKDWEKCNGFDNNFFGWGAEDDDLFRRCTLARVLQKYNFRHFHTQKEKKYFNIHMENDHRDKNYKYISKRWATLSKDKSNSYKKHGLNDVKYNVTSVNIEDNISYYNISFGTHI